MSTSENAYTSQDVPTSLVMRRSFIIADDLGAGDFSITYKADDAIDFFLNGELIIGCRPPAHNPGFCQQVCNTSAIPAAALRPPGELNTLEARLINLQSVSAGDGNFGYTALNYPVCVDPGGGSGRVGSWGWSRSTQSGAVTPSRLARRSGRVD